MLRTRELVVGALACAVTRGVVNEGLRIQLRRLRVFYRLDRCS
jgi:hypothetical protein